MKLSNKIFLTTYITVLLCLGLSGTFLIEYVTDSLFKAEEKQIKYANSYAAESFYAFTDVSYGEITDTQKQNIIGQIKASLGNNVAFMDILSEKEIGSEYSKLEDNSGISRYIKNDDVLILKTVSRLKTTNGVYYIQLYYDLSSTLEQGKILKDFYVITVLLFSAISGLLLFLIAKRATYPLRRLKDAAYDIANGSYGKTVVIKSGDIEIKELSSSFNSMSQTIEQKIAQIRKEAEKRDLFVADFTHEIKTPITAIIGYSQMLDGYSLTKEEQSSAIKTIYSEGKRLESLSLQLLNLYVLKNEEVTLYPVNLKEIEEQLNATLKFSCEKYAVTLKTIFPEIWVKADKNLLLSLLYNLCDNAFKASNKNGVVNIYCEENGEKIKILVQDNGKGISQKNIKMLTEPFYREDKARSRQAGGAGLGLSICKAIAELHQSSLTFDSKKGNGCTVSFELYIRKELK